MKLFPCGNRIIVKPTPVEKTTASGLIIPCADDVKRICTGTVFRVGDPESFFLQVGEEVIYDRYLVTEVEFEGETYLIMNPDAILAVVEE